MPEEAEGNGNHRNDGARKIRCAAVIASLVADDPYNKLANSGVGEFSRDIRQCRIVVLIGFLLTALL